MKNQLEKIYYSSCRANCFGGCRLKITVRDGKIVKTAMAEFPDERYNRICMRGLSNVQRVYHPERLKYPLKRVGPRGNGQWEKITWDEAISEIAETWTKMQRESGDRSIGFFHGTGSFSSIAKDSVTRLRNLMGATTIAPVMDRGVLFGTKLALGVGDLYNGNEQADLLNAGCIIVWGGNPADAQVQNWKFIRQAQKKGAKLIVIDPNYTTTASKADIYVPIRPGTDAALALAMMNIVVKNNWVDENFLRFRSVAPFLVKENDGTFLREHDMSPECSNDTDGRPIVWDTSRNTFCPEDEATAPALNGKFSINGTEVSTAYDLLIKRINEFPLEYAAKLCDLSEELICKITEEYVKNSPSSIINGFGPDHYTNGHDAVFAACCLAILTGNVGRKGASCGHQMSLGFFLNPELTHPKEGKDSPVVPILCMPEVLEEKAFMGQEFELRSLYVYAGNPVGNVAERKRLLSALDKLELIVVPDFFMSETAEYADIVLPVCHWFEYTDFDGLISPIPFIKLQEKVIEPQFESRSDFEIVKAIAEKMGLAEFFQMNERTWMERAFDTELAQSFGISAEGLYENKVLRAAAKGPYIYGEHGFNTPTGRAEFYIEKPRPETICGQKIDAEKERLPHWTPPSEAWSENPLFEKYPLVYIQERPKYRVHTQWTNVPWLLELDKEPIVKLNPADAGARGISNGDTVKVFNDRGFVVLRAVISDGTRPGTLVVPKGWQKHQFIDGHYQDLTSQSFNPMCVNNCYFDALVEVEKCCEQREG